MGYNSIENATIDPDGEIGTDGTFSKIEYRWESRLACEALRERIERCTKTTAAVTIPG